MIRLKDGFDGERALVLPQLITQFMEKDPLLAALHITDIGYYPKASHHFRERTTPINQFVFIYCIDGAGWYRVNGYTYEVHENQYFILPAGMPHAYGADEGNPWTIYWIHFKGTLASCYAKNAAQPMEILPERHFRLCDEEDSGLSDEEQKRKGPKNRPKHTRKRIHQDEKNFLKKFKTVSYTEVGL